MRKNRNGFTLVELAVVITIIALVMMLIAPVLSAAIRNARIFNGPELTERGEVMETCFVPAGHGSGTSLGITTKGSMAIGSTSVTIPERYAVVFKCQHGQFVIDGDRGKELFRRLPRGTQVVIRYCEELRAKNGVTNAVDLHFIDAVPVVPGEAEAP